jgi:uncharacterized protein (TIGR03437 family)
MKYLALFLPLCFLPPAFAQENDRVRLERIATGITQCTDIQSARDGSGRLFLVQQNGLIRLWRNGTLETANVLDLRGRISTGGERGLLGLAFPPDFAARQYFYVNYTNPSGATVVSRFRISSSNPNQADANSEQILLTIPQPFSNHNGGQLQFGPDGYLYIGTGDGGGANDPVNAGQDPRTLLGKMLRIQVEPNLSTYQIPPDNPFAGNSNFLPEIWALGLRNPWRYAFDPLSGDLYIADVGQNRFEEINFQPASSRGGENYGWVTMEGRECVRAGCNTQGLTLPVHVYPRTEGLSITGGYVRNGTYYYGDYVTGRVWALRRQGGQWVNELVINLTSTFAISTFGQDENGTLYVANHRNGEVFRFVLKEATAPQVSANGLVNAASFTPGLVPGSLATAFTAGLLSAPGQVLAPAVPLPRELSGIQLTLNGIAAPLLAVVRSAQGEQVNFQVPWEITSGQPARLRITSSGAASEEIEIPIARLAPGIFSQDNRTALVIDAATFQLATGPLARNRDYILYATGLGPLQNPPATGNASPAAVRITGNASLSAATIPAEITYAGSAPGFPGVYQVNFRLASGTPGGEQDLVLSVDGISGPARKILLTP